MKINDFIVQLEKAKAEKNIFEQIARQYQIIDTDAPAVIFSLEKKGMFFDDKNFIRLLSLDEVIKASEELHVDFINLSIIPIFDIMDNDFICYDYKSKTWCKYNIIDEVKYKTNSQLINLI